MRGTEERYSHRIVNRKAEEMVNYKCILGFISQKAMPWLRGCVAVN